jgi:hypothetical protein
MARALGIASESEILRANPRMTAKYGSYFYEVAREGGQTTYSVTDGHETLRVTLPWAFGQGSAGQTWLFQLEGRWYESRVSYYSELRGLDLTMGMQDIAVHNLREAAGRLLGRSDTADCFACHATNAVKDHELSLPSLVPGVQCDRCHGSSERHLAGVSSGSLLNSRMHKLSELSTDQLSDACGKCHRSWSEIAANGPRGVLNVRFQPYRLTLSRCYDAEDRRIRCTACHDPHRGLETNARSYDLKCRACHSRNASPATKASAHLCPVGTEACVTCHMPKVELPGSHKSFADHRIRIVKAGEGYPD